MVTFSARPSPTCSSHGATSAGPIAPTKMRRVDVSWGGNETRSALRLRRDGVRAVRFERRPSKLSASLLAAERRLVARSGWSLRLFVDEGPGLRYGGRAG